MPTTLRRKETEELYKKYKEQNSSGVCAICRNSPIKSFKYWKLIMNDFPYDMIAKRHQMLAPIRHIKEDGLTKEELEEFKEVKKIFLNDDSYNILFEATNKTKTILSHFHLHLMEFLPQDELW